MRKMNYHWDVLKLVRRGGVGRGVRILIFWNQNCPGDPHPPQWGRGIFLTEVGGGIGLLTRIGGRNEL